jgi:glutamate dehydrogenase
MRLDFLRGLARTKLGKSDPLAATEEWGRQHKGAIDAFRGVVHRAENTVTISAAMLAQIASQARNLLAR